MIYRVAVLIALIASATLLVIAGHPVEAGTAGTCAVLFFLFGGLDVEISTDDDDEEELQTPPVTIQIFDGTLQLAEINGAAALGLFSGGTAEINYRNYRVTNTEIIINQNYVTYQVHVVEEE